MSHSVSETWTLEGDAAAGALPIHGNTHTPEGEPRSVCLVIHGWTGHKDRNITPVMTGALAESGHLVHRFTLSRAGVEKDADDLTKLDEFYEDSLEQCVADIRRVANAVAEGKLTGRGLPLVLVGHSRAGATIVRCAARAREPEQGWAMEPAALVSLAGTSVYTRFLGETREEFERQGYVERECARAPGGVVRMGPSWYRHHLEHPDRNLYEEDAARVRCPVLIVHGDADTSVRMVHADQAQAMLEAGDCPRVERADITGGDHNFNAKGYITELEGEDDPAAVAAKRAVTAFLDRVLKDNNGG